MSGQKMKDNVLKYIAEGTAIIPAYKTASKTAVKTALQYWQSGGRDGT
jgi:hypothetical protein